MGSNPTDPLKRCSSAVEHRRFSFECLDARPSTLRDAERTDAGPVPQDAAGCRDAPAGLVADCRGHGVRGRLRFLGRDTGDKPMTPGDDFPPLGTWLREYRPPVVVETRFYDAGPWAELWQPPDDPGEVTEGE